MAYKKSKRSMVRRRRNVNKRYKRKRYYRKGGLQKGRVTGIQSGFPEVLMTKLSYAENNFNFTLAENTTMTLQQISANDPYDPYTGLGGKSALYFHTYAGIYKYCRVLGARITVRFTKETDFNQGVNVAIVPRIGVSSPVLTDYDDVMSQPRVRYSNRTLNRVGDSVTLKYYLPINTMLQMNKLQYIAQLPSDKYDCTISTSPIERTVFDIYTMRTNTSDLREMLVHGNVHVKYYCKFYQRYRYIAAGTDNNEDTLDAGEVAKPDEIPELAFDDY